MATVKQLYDLLDRKAPFRTQMDFDNAGFLVGRGDRTVTRVLVALDITPEVIAAAAEKGCQLILAHHPVIWGKLGQVTDESATGRKVLALIEKGIAAICAHTNLDAAEGGVNTALAQRLGLENPVPLESDGVDEAGRPYGIGRMGSLPGGLCPEGQGEPGPDRHPGHGRRGAGPSGGGGGRRLRLHAAPGEGHGVRHFPHLRPQARPLFGGPGPGNQPPGRRPLLHRGGGLPGAGPVGAGGLPGPGGAGGRGAGGGFRVFLKENLVKAVRL